MNFVDKDGTTKVYIRVHPCHSGKLQIVDLLYLWQLNEAILLFNSIALQFFLKCLLSLLYLSNSGRSKNNDVNSSY